MKKTKISACVLAALLLLGVFLWLWSRSQTDSENPDDDPAISLEKETVPLLDTTLSPGHGDEVVFSATLEEFIACFNSRFESALGPNYFLPALDWNIRDYPVGIHSQYPVRQFCFSEDETVAALPTVTIYTPMEDHRIGLLTVNFDEHSYTDVGFQRYRQLCVCVVKLFIPEFTDEAALEFCDQVISLGNQNVFESDAWYASGAVPAGLYYRGEIGVYPYFAIGDWQHFCVIPVTEQSLKDFSEKGVMLYEVE